MGKEMLSEGKKNQFLETPISQEIVLLLFFRSEYLQDKNHGPRPRTISPWGFSSHLLCAVTACRDEHSLIIWDVR